MVALVAACCCVCRAEPSAHATLAGVSCLFPSPHDGSRHRLVLRVDVAPGTQGWSVVGMPQARRIKGRDSSGNELTSELSSWEPTPGNAESSTAYFSFMLQSRTAWVEVNEMLQVQLAERKVTLRLGEVNLLEPGVFSAEGIELRLVPDASNAESDNRDKDGTLHRAGLRLVYPASLHVMRVCRVWKGGRDEETGTEMPPYLQPLEMVRGEAPEGEKATCVELRDAAPGEALEVTVCMNRESAAVPMKFRAMLGDPAPPAAERKPAQVAAAP